MRLTARQRYVLERLNSDDPDIDLVECNGSVWIGDEQTSQRLLVVLLRNALVSTESYEGHDCYRYHINDWGRRVLSDPSFEPQMELAKLIARAEKAGRDMGRSNNDEA